MGSFGYEKVAIVIHFLRRVPKPGPWWLMVHTKYELNFGFSAKQQTSSTKLPGGDPSDGLKMWASEIIKINLAKGINYHENGWQAILERLGFDLWFHNP